jgi:hypothetical protein
MISRTSYIRKKQRDGEESRKLALTLSYRGNLNAKRFSPAPTTTYCWPSN